MLSKFFPPHIVEIILYYSNPNHLSIAIGSKYTLKGPPTTIVAGHKNIQNDTNYYDNYTRDSYISLFYYY